MSLIQLLDQVDPDKFEKEAREEFLDRKNALNKMGNWGKNLALSMVPLGAIAAFAEPARAQSQRTIIEVLQYALLLEYLEGTFYTKAEQSGVYEGKGPEVVATFDEIGKNENSHVAFLKETISNLGADPRPKPNFNYNVAGLKPFENYKQFLIMSQAFEDTGVRAYKGQAAFLAENDTVLTAALRIHGVEARHASAVRRIRGIQGWIPDTQPDFPDAFQGVYLGNDLQEDNVVHLGINVADITDIPRVQVTESFDEPLSADYVSDIAALFIEGS